MKGLEAIRYSGAGLFFVGAVLLALLAGFTVYGYLSAAVPSQEVWTVFRELEPGAVITEADLQAKKVPDGAVPAGAVRDAGAVTGRRVRYGLAAGDILREQHLVPEANGDVAARVGDLGGELRAVMLPADLVPAMERLVPGDRLELTGVVPYNDGRLNSTMAVPLGVATVLDVRLAQGQSDRSSVLVALPAADVPKLALSMRTGTLLVAVRGPGETGDQAAALRLDALTGSGPAVTAAAVKQ